MAGIEGHNRDAFIRFQNTIRINIAVVDHDVGRLLTNKPAGKNRTSIKCITGRTKVPGSETTKSPHLSLRLHSAYSCSRGAEAYGPSGD
jgi:hypothetical protein